MAWGDAAGGDRDLVIRQGSERDERDRYEHDRYEQDYRLERDYDRESTSPARAHLSSRSTEYLNRPHNSYTLII